MFPWLLKLHTIGNGNTETFKISRLCPKGFDAVMWYIIQVIKEKKVTTILDKKIQKAYS